LLTAITPGATSVHPIAVLTFNTLFRCNPPAAFTYVDAPVWHGSQVDCVALAWPTVCSPVVGGYP
jgi:hypothetical protein